jgi:hypothetical protein
MIISWNVERKSLGAFEQVPDTVQRIVKGIADVVKTGDQAADTPFIAFLLEIKGIQQNVDLMSTQLAAEYQRQTGRTAVFEAHATGGAATTAESIIVMHSRGVAVSISGFDVQAKMGEFIVKNKSRAEERARDRFSRATGKGLRSADKDVTSASRRAKPERYNPYRRPYKKEPTEQEKQAWYRDVKHEAEWFRNGVIATVTHGANEIKIASIHAPGPDLSNTVPGIVDTMIARAATEGVDVLIGDFNRHGTYAGAYYDDITEDWTTGTSFKKKSPGVLTESRWDRVLAKKGRMFNIVSEDPIPVTRPEHLGLGSLTDHALVYARLSDLPVSVPNLFEGLKASEPFSLDVKSESALASSENALLVSSPGVSPPRSESPLTEPSVSESNPRTASEEMDLELSVAESNQLTAPEEMEMDVANDLLAQLPSVPTAPLMSGREFAAQFPSVPKNPLMSEREFAAQFPSVPKNPLTSEEELTAQLPSAPTDSLMSEEEELAARLPSVPTNPPMSEEEELAAQLPDVPTDPLVSTDGASAVLEDMLALL